MKIIALTLMAALAAGTGLAQDQTTSTLTKTAPMAIEEVTGVWKAHVLPNGHAVYSHDQCVVNVSSYPKRVVVSVSENDALVGLITQAVEFRYSEGRWLKTEARAAAGELLPYPPFSPLTKTPNLSKPTAPPPPNEMKFWFLPGASNLPDLFAEKCLPHAKDLPAEVIRAFEDTQGLQQTAQN